VKEVVSMRVLFGAVGLLVLAAAGPGQLRAAEPPPGGSAWVRHPVDGRGKPPGFVQYEYFCSACHDEGPEKRPGTEALRAKYKGEKPALLSERTDLTPEFVKYMVRNGVSVMPFFRKTEISDADLDAIAAYLTRNNQAQANGSVR
jgi:mono/diheme cytochrome c family protein